MNHRLLLKLLAWGIALTLVLLPVVGVLNGWFAADRWPVRYLRVDAEFNHVSAEQIRAATAAHLGTGFFAIDLDRVRASVAALPWVERVEVRKRWPDTLEVRMVEREPFARWGADRLISRDRTLFSAPGAESIQGLPNLAGPDDELDAVVDFYNGSARLFTGTGLAVTGVKLSARGGWTLALAGGAEIELGRERPQERLRRFVDIWPRIAPAHGAAFERADLRYANGFAVRWTDAAAPAATNKPVAQRCRSSVDGCRPERAGSEVSAATGPADAGAHTAKVVLQRQPTADNRPPSKRAT